MAASAAAARLAQRHTDLLSARSLDVGRAAQRAWAQLGGLDDADLARWLDAIAQPMLGLDAAAFDAGSGYVRVLAQLAEAPVGEVPRYAATIEQYRELWRGPVLAARGRIAEGASYEDAMEAGAARAEELGRTGYANANREGSRRTMDATEGIDRYRRVPDGNACAYCRKLAERTYRTAELAPTHAGCGCGVMPEFAESARATMTAEEAALAERATFDPAHPRPGMGDTVRANPADFRAGDTGTPYLNDDGTWAPERQELHDRIVRNTLSGAQPSDSPEMLFMGGGGGAGKTTTIRAGAIKTPEGGVILNADDFKELLPETIRSQAEGNRAWAALAHEESSYLAKRVQAAALERRVPVVMDAVGSNADKVARQISQARAAGYRVRTAYVTIPPEEGVARAAARAANMEAKGIVGRVIPEETVRNAHWGANRSFQAVAELADEAVLVDNTTTPKIVATYVKGTRKVVDPELWADFLTRGGPGAGG